MGLEEKLDANFKIINRELIKKYFKEGWDVGIIGGGFGVTSYAALQVSCSVTAYEPDKERIQFMRDNIDSDDFKCILAHVGPKCDVEHLGDAKRISSLPDFDALEIDCEGCEKELLSNLEISPEIIIVETHPDNGSAQKDLDLDNYTLIDQEPDSNEGKKLVFSINAVTDSKQK